MSKINNWMTRKYVELKQREEEAQGLAEYGLILALVAVVCIAGVTLLGNNIAAVLNNLAGQI